MHSIWYKIHKIASASGALPQTPKGTYDAPHTPYRSFLPSAIFPLCTINASLVQGFGLGPTDFVIAISSLKPKYSGNRLTKYAYDSYLLVPASRIDSTLSE